LDEKFISYQLYPLSFQQFGISPDKLFFERSRLDNSSNLHKDFGIEPLTRLFAMDKYSKLGTVSPMFSIIDPVI